MNQSRFKREQPTRLKNLEWYEEPLTFQEKILIAAGWIVAGFCLAVLIWSFF